MKGYIKLRKKALDILLSEMSDNLYYHRLEHTLDVLKVCNLSIRRENLDPEAAKLLRIGALFHDIGFIDSYIDHEEKGVEIAEKWMKEFGFLENNFEVVKGLILATRIPQSPKNYLEKIICDADLDYLGRPDFYRISNELFKELKIYTGLKDNYSWNEAQIKFLKAHKYHTNFALKNRQPHKEKRITELSKLV